MRPYSAHQLLAQPKKKPYDDKKEPEVTQTKLSFANVDQRQLAANTKAAFDKSEREYASPEAGLKRAKRQHEDHQRRLQSHKKKPRGQKKQRRGPKVKKNIALVPPSSPDSPLNKISMYATVWSALGFMMDSTRTMYPGVFDTLGFKGEQRTVAKETRLGTDLPETFTKANDSAAAEKKRKRNRQKKGKRELPDDAHNKWDLAMKQVVIAEVERLTTDYEEPAYTDAVNNLRTKYRAAFTEGGRDLRRQHAVRWWSKGYDGVRVDGRLNNLFGNRQGRKVVPEELDSELIILLTENAGNSHSNQLSVNS